MEEKVERQRTGKQNNSLYLYFKLLAEGLNESGLEMKKVLRPEIDIPWTDKTIKEFLWVPIQKKMLLKDSTKELTTKEISMVYEVLDRHLSAKTGFHMDFPHNPIPGIETE